MKATLQALQTLPEENYLVLRFLTAFLVQVGLGAGLSARLEWGRGALLLDLGAGAGLALIFTFSSILVLFLKEFQKVIAMEAGRLELFFL